MNTDGQRENTEHRIPDTGRKRNRNEE